jgi:hypothetical protein
VIGFSPEQVGRMSLFQFAACVDGFNAAHSPDSVTEAPTVEEFIAAKKLHGDFQE